MQRARAARAEPLRQHAARTGGGFSRANLTWLRLQRVGALHTLSVSLAAQFASKNLDSSQKMALGGTLGVRAYPQDEAPGDQGSLARLELRHDLPASRGGVWQLTAFLDAGHVKSNFELLRTGASKRTCTCCCCRARCELECTLDFLLTPKVHFRARTDRRDFLLERKDDWQLVVLECDEA